MTKKPRNTLASRNWVCVSKTSCPNIFL